MSKDRILLVEGNEDRLFFEEICKSLDIAIAIHVAVPREYMGFHNTKQAAINALETIFKLLPDGRVKRLGIIVDADHKASHGVGASGTLEQILLKAQDFGFVHRSKISEHGGYMLRNNDGLAPLGVWIMPNNANDGSKEDWVLDLVTDAEKAPVQYAFDILRNVPGGVKYRNIDANKAALAAWMSWQAMPGQGLHQAARNYLIDMTKPTGKHLKDWLTATFA